MEADKSQLKDTTRKPVPCTPDLLPDCWKYKSVHVHGPHNTPLCVPLVSGEAGGLSESGDSEDAPWGSWESIV